MVYYDKHCFFCTNVRTSDKRSCGLQGAEALRLYAKEKLRALVSRGQIAGNMRINAAGCLNRCSEGPVLVVYPEGVWYTYRTREDIDEILEQHLGGGRIVERLVLKNSL